MICLLHAWNTRVERSEGLAVMGIQIRHLAQLLTPLLFAFGLFTFAGDGLAKIGMTKRHIEAQIARPFAARTNASGCDRDRHRGRRNGSKAVRCSRWFSGRY